MSQAVATIPTSSAREMSAPRFYAPELDALRFFAFFGVFMFHAAPRTMDFYAAAGCPAWLSKILISIFGAGAYGVDLFFALSAYLITTLLLHEIAKTGKVDVRGFYIRRILRIWPLYLGFVAFAAMAALFLSGQKLAMRYVVGYSLLAGNWIYVFYGLPASFAIPLWTVSIEEQFYLAWPVAVRRVSKRALAAIAVGILLVANLWRIWLAITAAPVETMEYSTFTRLDPIALGILIALYAGRLPRLARWHRVALLLSGVLASLVTYRLCVFATPLTVSNGALAASHSLTALASGAILLSLLGASNSFLRNRMLLYLGKISYGLYVLHEFAHFCAMRWLPAVTPLRVTAQSALGFVLTVALAAASYRWLESPFLRLKE